MQVDFGKAFTYIFDDPKWFDKIIIPILFGLIPIVGPGVFIRWPIIGFHPNSAPDCGLIISTRWMSSSAMGQRPFRLI